MKMSFFILALLFSPVLRADEIAEQQDERSKARVTHEFNLTVSGNQRVGLSSDPKALLDVVVGKYSHKELSQLYQIIQTELPIEKEQEGKLIGTSYDKSKWVLAALAFVNNLKVEQGPADAVSFEALLGRLDQIIARVRNSGVDPKIVDYLEERRKSLVSRRAAVLNTRPTRPRANSSAPARATPSGGRRGTPTPAPSGHRSH